MAESFRRIVTGHDAAGMGVFVSTDTLTPTVIDSGDAEFQLVWTSPAVPVDFNNGSDGPIPAGKTLHGGAVMRMVNMLPGGWSPMHRSFSLDYGVILSGSVELELEGGEIVTANAGDVIVQRGTNHRWRNPSKDTVCRMAFVLIEAKPVIASGKTLEEIHP